MTEQAKGLYSAKAAEKYGTVFWRDDEGKEYEITAWATPSSYKWEDAVIVSEKPLRYARQGQPGETPIYWPVVERWQQWSR